MYIAGTPYVFVTKLVRRQMHGAVGTPSDFLPNDILVDSELGAVGVVARVLGTRVQGFLPPSVSGSGLGVDGGATERRRWQPRSRNGGTCTHLDLAVLGRRSLVLPHGTLVLLRSGGRSARIGDVDQRLFAGA